MTTRTHRESLKVQLLDTERLIAAVDGHPLMTTALADRQRDLQERIAALPLGGKEARTVLLFSGEPVQGSVGIDASFAGRVLEPFQSMVMAHYADRWHGVVGSRGRRTGEAQSRLLLTGLPRGSFGLELKRADNDELFEEDQLADTLAQVTRLVESAARSDEDFAVELNDTTPRVVQNLRNFLETVAKGKAGLRLESGDFRCDLNPVQANEAFNRVSGTITNDEPVKIHGVFKGVLLESWKFDFLTEDNHRIGGKIDDNLSEQQVVELNQRFFNRPCVAAMSKSTVLFKNGRARTTHTLSGLADA